MLRFANLAVALLACFASAMVPPAIRAQTSPIKWGPFSSQRARRYFEQSVQLTPRDAKMLGLYLLGVDFDAAQLSQVPEFAPYFAEFNRASDEFQRNSTIGTIRERFTARQRQLAPTKYIRVDALGVLAEYS